MGFLRVTELEPCQSPLTPLSNPTAMLKDQEQTEKTRTLPIFCIVVTAELALAHVIENQVVAAYRRGGPHVYRGPHYEVSLVSGLPSSPWESRQWSTRS